MLSEKARSSSTAARIDKDDAVPQRRTAPGIDVTAPDPQENLAVLGPAIRVAPAVPRVFPEGENTRSGLNSNDCCDALRSSDVRHVSPACPEGRTVAATCASKSFAEGDAGGGSLRSNE